MIMRRFFHTLFSKALLLTYAFIGYLAISEAEVPLCVVDAVYQFQNDRSQSSTSVRLVISSSNHVRPEKQASSADAERIEPLLTFPDRHNSETIVSFFYSTSQPHSISAPSRAPPVS